MICVSISQLLQLNQAIASGAELIELRLDLIREDPAHIYQSIPDRVNTIATCRPGAYDDSERIQVLKECMNLGATYIDIEVDSSDSDLKIISSHAQKCGSRMIVSYHNFEQAPERNQLESMLHRCYNRGGEIAKIAVQVSYIQDLRNLLSLYDLPGKKVVIGMGDLGRITRVMGPYLGAEFTFASLDKEGETAPGQLSMKQLIDIYKVIEES